MSRILNYTEEEFWRLTPRSLLSDIRQWEKSEKNKAMNIALLIRGVNPDE